jgi:UDP-N-acetylmuramoyl-L-alanyl-D-glutamate--2,6-diaminopimelate ligase
MPSLSASTRGVSLRDLLPEAEIIGADDIRVTSCASDARGVRPGDLLVLGHDPSANQEELVRIAVGRGAAAVMSERPAPGHDLPTCLVADGREAFGRLCHALAGHPGRALKVVGICGARGREAAAQLTASVLAMGGYPAGCFGTLGCHDGITWRLAAALPATPPALANWLSDCHANGCSHAVLEVSRSTLVERGLAGLELDVAAVTRLDAEGAAAATDANLLVLERLAAEGMAIVNADDPAADLLVARADGPALSFGLDRPAEVSATLLERSMSEQTFLLAMGDETIPVRTSLVGRQGIESCLVAAAVGSAYGIDPATIVRGIEAVAKVPWRLERLECGQPFGVFVDRAVAAEPVAAALSALRPVTAGRLTVVLVGEQGADPVFARVAAAAAQGADVAVMPIGQTAGRQPNLPSADGHSIARPIEVRILPDAPAAVRWAIENAAAGDCVLIAGAEHNAARGFDAREYACQCLFDSPAGESPHRLSA